MYLFKEKSQPDDSQKYVIPKKSLATNSEKIDVVGIDLGTSRCCAAVNRKNGIETVALDYKGERLLPSFVSYCEKNPICGQLVIDRLRFYAKSTVFDTKRIIGKNFENVIKDKNWPFKLINAEDKPLIEIETGSEVLRKTPKQIATVLLNYVKQKAEEYQGHKLSKAIITVPASFTEAQKKVTRSAAILAGFDDIELLPEPIAAAFAYFIDRPLPNNSTVLLFDLGGGTLDVCIFKIKNDQIQIISQDGDSQLGGRDFDNVLIDYFGAILQSDYRVSELGDKKYKLMLECQKIKETISTINESWLDVEDFDPAKTGIIKINQNKFENLAKEYISRIRDIIFSALNKIKHNPKQIDKVLYVGGGSRMPMIRRMLEGIFPHAEQCCEKHPDEVVAVGAAYYGYHIFSSNNFKHASRIHNGSLYIPSKMSHKPSFKEPAKSDHKLLPSFHQSSLNIKERYVLPKKENLLRAKFQAIGIDLGTSRRCVAVNRNGQIATIPLDNSGERLLPSYFSYDEKNIMCGQVVVRRMQRYSKSTVFDSKRIIGKSFNEIEIDSNWPFSVNNENGKILIEVNGFNGKQSVTAEEVTAELLKHIEKKAYEFQGTKINNAVITVPLSFTDAQKSATMAAAILAGFDNTELLPEPIAAAFAYFIDRPIPNNSTVLLFDLGGQTLDVCIFKIQNDHIQIISNTSDSKLGGRNFDRVLVNYFKNLLKTKYGIYGLKDKKYKLLLECQKIKEDLSCGENTW
uniref:Heat shock protein 70 n=1 Tax=Panagrolaimus sp. ES5 TaxID=591445 RepID=A0AC34FEM0_9BILA